MKPLKEWICDHCNQIIECPVDGFVIWQEENQRLFDIKIVHHQKVVHHQKCDDEHYRYSNHLDIFLGIDGLQYLLSMLSVGQLMNNNSNCQIKTILPLDMDEFIDFFRRCQAPYYEEARTKFNETSLLEISWDWNEYSPYKQQTLKNIIDNY